MSYNKFDNSNWQNTLVTKQLSFRKWMLNLIASENIMSPDVFHYYTLPLGYRYGNYEGLDVKTRE